MDHGQADRPSVHPGTTLTVRSDTPVTQNEVCIKPGMLHFAITTDPKIYRLPSTRARAIAQLDASLASSALLVISEPAG
jgi:hypothetical protein